MSICSLFCKARLPYLLVPFFSAAIAAVSWMSMTAAGLPSATVQVVSAVTFVVIGAVSTAYFMHCLGRYATQNQA